jgi:hypothetical protein
MAARIDRWTLDVRGVATTARFWSRALGYRVDPDGQHPWPLGGDASAPSVWLQEVDAPTPGTNRGHVDLVAVGGDAEVARLVALGARPADVGQAGDEGFVVPADPEGNESCVLRGPGRA